MANRTLRVLSNDRFAAAGFWLDRDGFHAAWQDPDDELTYTLDFQDWLGSGETISSYAQTVVNCTVSEDALSSPQVSFEISAVSGRGDVTTQITTSTGDKKSVTVRFYERER